MHHGGRGTVIATATDVNICGLFLRSFLGGPLRDNMMRNNEPQIYVSDASEGLTAPFSVTMRPGAIAVHAVIERLPQADQDAIRCA